MSKTLNLADRVLAMAKNLAELGREGDALRLLDRLAGWQQLPTSVAEETYACLAAIRLRHHQYTQARHALAAALVYRPDNARYHYLLATTLERDQKGGAQAAYEHYRRSLELDPDQPDCLSAFGRLALAMEKHEEGLQALRRAVDLAPDNPQVIDKLVDGLHRCGRLEEARLTLRAALFRNRRIYAFQKRWNDFRFQQAREAQRAARHSRQAEEETERPALLPFLHLAPGGMLKARTRKRARKKAAGSLAYAHSPLLVRSSDQKHA